MDDDEFSDCLEGEIMELNMNEEFQPSENFMPFLVPFQIENPLLMPLETPWVDPDTDMTEIITETFQKMNTEIKDKLDKQDIVIGQLREELQQCSAICATLSDVPSESGSSTLSDKTLHEIQPRSFYAGAEKKSWCLDLCAMILVVWLLM